ncbi:MULTISPECIES: hypothetical protein [unclassified Streptomyces]|uniref:hypothetical protein n=1 Tax=unclassified Streptomyces TaxID=2593676 RepID=UPI003810FB6D
MGQPTPSRPTPLHPASPHPRCTIVNAARPPQGRREQQASICRLLLDYLNAPIAEGCHLRGVLPAPGAVRIALHAGDDDEGPHFLYEIPHDAVAPAYVPRILRIGADIHLADMLTALIATLPSLIEEEERHQPAPDDPHCDVLVDLTGW